MPKTIDGARSLILRSVAGLAVLVTAGHAVAQNPPPSDPQQQFREAAEKYRIEGGSEQAEAFELLPQPILNWSNPQRRTATGALFLWTLHGRPQVAMCTYPLPNQRFACEFQSLSTAPLSASVDGRTVWAPAEAGTPRQLFEQAPAPAPSPLLRRRQMLRLARAFSAQLVPPKKNAVPLRMLPTPIYRYSEPDSSRAASAVETIDGSLFAFVLGTDPEVLLAIEAVKVGEGEARWQYGLARMSMVPTEVRLDDKLIWETDWAIEHPSGPYWTTEESFTESARSR